METETAGHDLVVVGADTVGHEAGMPQLDFSTFPNQIFWLVLALFAIYYILSRIALPRIGAVLAERQGTITNDIAAAEELKLRAQESEKAYDQALADARVEAGRIVAAAKAEIQGELDESIARADSEIAEKTTESEKAIAEIRAGALESVEVVAKDTAEAIVAALSPEGTEVARTEVDAAVEARLQGDAR